MQLSHSRSDCLGKNNVKIKDWLSGCCPYQGCSYNDRGICTHEDEEFMDSLLKKVEELYKANNQISTTDTFKCININVDDEHCIYCGAKLVKHKDMQPYGDTSYPLIHYECPNC